MTGVVRRFSRYGALSVVCLAAVALAVGVVSLTTARDQGRSGAPKLDAERSPGSATQPSAARPGVRLQVSGGPFLHELTLVTGEVTGKELATPDDHGADPLAGHFVLIVDGAAVPEGQRVPLDDRHLHFDHGGDSLDVRLPVGQHTLTLQLVDGASRSFGRNWSDSQAVIVEPWCRDYRSPFAHRPKGASERFLAPVWASPVAGSRVPETFTVALAVDEAARASLGHLAGFAVGANATFPAEGEFVAGRPSTIRVDRKQIAFVDGVAVVEGTLTLPPGRYTLTAQGFTPRRCSLGPKASDAIDIEVVSGAQARSVTFAEPRNEATVSSPVTVKADVHGLALQPASGSARDLTAGHLHLGVFEGVNQDWIRAVGVGRVATLSAPHVDLDGGQRDVTLDLPPGRHLLTLQLADGAHQSLGASVRESIWVNVREADASRRDAEPATSTRPGRVDRD